MADTLRRRWTLQEYLDWEEKQETRNEFVDGRVRAMVGASRRHNRIGANVLSALVVALKGRKCQPFGEGMKIMIPNGNVRYGDVTVDCGPQNMDDIAASEPTVVVEVLSKSTAYVDQTDKLDDYQSIPSMRHILHLVQERPEAELWTRDGEAWRRVALSGLEAEIDLTAIGVKLQLAVAYDGVPFEEPGE
ncbi:MAG: Uma2 family endonuclease [Pseudomonadota bacterium]